MVANAIENLITSEGFWRLNQILLSVLLRLLYFPPPYHLSAYLGGFSCTIAYTCRKSPWQTYLRGAVFPKFHVWILQNRIFPKPRLATSVDRENKRCSYADPFYLRLEPSLSFEKAAKVNEFCKAASIDLDCS